MGLRSVICIFYKGRFVVAQYTQWDVYPSGEGVKILDFISVPGNIARLKAGLEHIYVPDNEELDKIQNELDRLEYEAREKDPDTYFRLENKPINIHYPSLSRDTGGDILSVIADATAEKRVPVLLKLGFVTDSSCVYAYVVDLDDEVFEAYSGLQRREDAPRSRLYDVGGESGYVPEFKESFSLHSLPSAEEFISILGV